MISQIVVGLVFTWFYDPTFGLFNAIIGTVGLGPINVLGDPNYATFGIIAAGLWPQTAYCMILYLTGLNAVDPEQVEAARLDGAKGWKMLWYVILPQLRPATFIAFVVTIIGALRSFDLISIMTNGGPFRIDPGAQLLHVRTLAFGIRVQDGLRRGDCRDPVPHHAGLHRLFPLADVPGREGGTLMFRARVDAICAPLPGAEKSDPWGGGHDAWKVCDKMFACIGAVDPGISVKTDSIETATMLIEAGVGTKARYFHRSWIRLPEDCPEEELRHRIETSYDIVRAGLTKKLQATLADREGG